MRPGAFRLARAIESRAVATQKLAKARRDPLTGVAGRALFLETVAMNSRRRRSRARCAAATPPAGWAAIGVATAIDGAPDATALLRNADAAMYAAKRGGKNRFVRYETLGAEAVSA